MRGFRDLELIQPEPGRQGADISCEKNGLRICVEVKSITKQSKGAEGLFLEDQLYEKVRDFATKAAAQLEQSARALQCDVKLLAIVLNWFAQTVLLGQQEYQQIVNKLEQDGPVRSLDGIDGVWFILLSGHDHFLFLNENGKRIDVDVSTPE
jgi:hypothetical protein